MKKPFIIIMSPSKTQHLKRPENMPFSQATKPSGALAKRTQVLLHRLKGLEKEGLGTRLHIQGKLLEETYKRYETYEHQGTNAAVCLYTGSVFKGLRLSEYSDETLAYLQSHVRILSAFYGVLRPFDEVRPYRLDMTGQIFEESSYSYWREAVNEALGDAKTIINLASEEFSQLVTAPMITLSFKEQSPSGKLSVKSTYAKIARGKMIDAIVSQRLKDFTQIQKLVVDQYVFRPELSSEEHWVYVREND